MATTRRETTVSQTGGRRHPLGHHEGRRNHNKINFLACQESRRALANAFEGLVPLLAQAAKTAAALHAISGSGSTVSLDAGNLAGFARFAVGAYPERTTELAMPPNFEALFAFAVINADLLLKPDHALGTWVNGRKRHVLDVVCLLSSLDEAIRLGNQHGQQSIYDLSSGTDVPLASLKEVVVDHLGKEE